MISVVCSRFMMPLGIYLSVLLFCGVALGQSVPFYRSALVLERTEPVADSDSVAVVLEGNLFSLDGTPAVGAVVVSSAGGQSVTGVDGSYRLSARVPVKAKSVRITAVSASSGKLIASSEATLSAASGNVSVPSMQLAQSSSCNLSWLPTFGGEPGVNQSISVLAVFDDGNGPRLYAGGSFTTAGGVAASGIAKWDGSSWSSLESDFTGLVKALTVFDDGSGPALYVGGGFTTTGSVAANRIAKWDGSSWAAVGSGVNNSVNALTVFDDGNGDRLYAGGDFTATSTGLLGRIAKWDGTSWTPLGSGFTQSVGVLSVFDDGNGARLFAGGNFTTAGGVAADGIAMWDGSSWSSVGGVTSTVLAMVVFDDGSGEALYAGGGFTIAGMSATVAKWDGSSWSSLVGGANPSARALTIFDDGGGAALYAGGGTNTGQVAKWDGSTWAQVGGLFRNRISDLVAFDDGTGSVLFASGLFVSTISNVQVKRIAKWDGLAWGPLTNGANDAVRALAVFDDGGGPALYAGGKFATVGGVDANRIAKWDGSTWEPLGSGMNHAVQALEVFDDGSGAALYAAGEFTVAGGAPMLRIAKWDGSTWTGLGTGMNSHIHALAVFNDGGGAKLYAAGQFSTAGGVAASRIANWDGTNWAPLGSGIATIPVSSVYALTVFDDGSGEALCAGGEFSTAGGTTGTKHIAKWDGLSWSALGSGMTGGGVFSLATYDDGGGEALYAGGDFYHADGLAADNLAKWDGSSWTPLGTGTEGFVFSLATFDDGTGTALYAGGSISIAGGLLANRIAKWDGIAWSAVGRGMDRSVDALAVFDDGFGLALYAGGAFTSALESHDSYLAKWGCPLSPFNEFCNGDGGDGLGCTDCPCTNNSTSGTVGGCLNSALTSARLIATGNASVSLPSGDSSDLRFSINGAPANAFCILNSGDALAPTGMANPCFGLASGVQAIAFDGLRCAVVNTRRHGGRSADANGDVGVTNSPWGGEGGPPVGIANAGAGFASGQTRYFQIINRDDPLAQCMRGLNTSQAVEVVFEP